MQSIKCVFISSLSFRGLIIYKGAMEVTLPQKTMSNSDILNYVSILSIRNFRGVLMRDELPIKPNNIECGILNLNTHKQLGSHWVCWYKNGMERYYFDSFGEPPPLELIHYLKTSAEIDLDLPAIRRSSVTVQRYGSNECGSLCLYVLKMLTKNKSFSMTLLALTKRFLQSPISNLTIKL